MSRTKKLAVAGAAVLATLVGGVAYALDVDDCGPVPQLSKATGPAGSAAPEDADKSGPLCAKPVPAVAPIGQ